MDSSLPIPGMDLPSSWHGRKPATSHVMPAPCRLELVCKAVYTVHLLYVNNNIKRQALSPCNSAVPWNRRLPMERYLGTNGFYLSCHLNSKYLCSCIGSFPFQEGGRGGRLGGGGLYVLLFLECREGLRDLSWCRYYRGRFSRLEMISKNGKRLKEQ